MLLEDIRQAQLTDETIDEADYTKEVLSEADISRVDFSFVTFTGCRFIGCDFSGSSFRNTRFVNCDLSGCHLTGSYWKYFQITGCKAEGADLSESLFREGTAKENDFAYANFSCAGFENCRIEKGNFTEGFLSDVKLKKTAFCDCDFTRTDFFKTRLWGLDLSDCILTQNTFSDTLEELRGVKLNALQAVEIAAILGIEII